MALKLADRLESNNPKAYGIVKATEVSGHRTITTLNGLYNIPDCILSQSKNNTDNDAIGLVWYVVTEHCKYQLVNWNNRKNSNGWSRCEDIRGIEAGDRIQLSTNSETGVITISADSEIDDTLNSSSSTTWSTNKIKDVINGPGTQLITDDGELKLKVKVDDSSIGIDEDESFLQVLSVDGGLYNNYN